MGEASLFSVPEFRHPDGRRDLELEAAFEIAQEAHKSESRRNGNPYITHPILVCNLVQWFGENTPKDARIQKGVALLHDVVESKNGFGNVRDLQEALTARIKKKYQEDYLGTPDILWVNAVCRGVKELTNGASMFEDKRTYQVLSIPDMMALYRPVKIFDQIASVIDGGIGFRPLITLDDNAKKTAQRLEYQLTGHDEEDLKEINLLLLNAEKGFALKGLDLSRACRNLDNSLDRKMHKLHEFYRAIYGYFRMSYNCVFAEAGDKTGFEKLQKRFSEFDRKRIAALIAEANTARMESDLPEKVIHYNNRSMENIDWSMNKGVAFITISHDSGKVVGIGLYVIPGAKKQHPINTVKNTLLDDLERQNNHDGSWQFIGTELDGKRPKQHLKFLGTEEFRTQGETAVRHFSMEPPMALGTFLRICEKAQAFGKADKIWAKTVSAQEEDRLGPHSQRSVH